MTTNAEDAPLPEPESESELVPEKKPKPKPKAKAPVRTAAQKRTRSIRISRDTVLFIAGLAGIGYETLTNGGDRPTLLIMFSAMVGLPAFLNKDEKNKDDVQKRASEEDQEEDE